MKFISFFFVTTSVVVLLNPIFQFWAIMILIALLAIVMGSSGGAAFFGGGLGMGVAWLGQSFFIVATTGSPLAEYMAELMGLGSGLMIHLVTAALGFLLGSFSGLTGSLFRAIMRRKPTGYYKRR